MISAADIKAQYAAVLQQTVTIRRYTGTGLILTKPRHDAPARARVLPDVEAKKLVADLKTSEKVVVVLAGDLLDGGLTLPLLATDKAIVDGAELAQSIHEKRAALDGALIAYVLRVGGGA